MFRPGLATSGPHRSALPPPGVWVACGFRTWDHGPRRQRLDADEDRYRLTTNRLDDQELTMTNRALLTITCLWHIAVVVSALAATGISVPILVGGLR